VVDVVLVGVCCKDDFLRVVEEVFAARKPRGIAMEAWRSGGNAAAVTVVFNEPVILARLISIYCLSRRPWWVLREVTVNDVVPSTVSNILSTISSVSLGLIGYCAEGLLLSQL